MNEDNYLMGGCNISSSTNKDRLFLCGGSDSRWKFGYRNVSTGTSSRIADASQKISFNSSHIYEFKLNHLGDGKSSVKDCTTNISGETIISDYSTDSLPSSSILIGAYNTAYLTYYKYSIYGAQISKNNSIVANLVPVVRVSDNNFGLYDTIRQTFLSNSNIKGGYYSGKLPFDLFTEVDYIINYNQGTNYPFIDTNLTTSSNIGYYIKTQPLTSDFITKDNYLIGAMGEGTSRLFTMGMYQSGWTYGYASTSSADVIVATSEKLPFDTTHTYESTLNYLNDKICTYKDIDASVEFSRNMGGSASLSALPIYIFRTNGLNRYSKAKIYNVKITDGNSIIADFHPCYRNLDNVVGMYDIVRSEFFENANTSGGYFSIT